MKKSKKLLLISTVSAIIILPVIGLLWYVWGGIMKEFRGVNIDGIRIALQTYTWDHDVLPPPESWCDMLIAEADCSPKMFRGFLVSESECGYALNANLEGLKYKDLDGHLVLLFEAQGPWNLAGGPELIDSQKQKDVAVICVNGYFQIVKPRDIDQLRWDP